MMPYPNEHACRLNDPGKYKKFRRKNGDRDHNGKKYDVIYGITADGTAEEQAYRYPKDTWEASEARSHCKSHKGSFEAAGESDCLPCCGEMRETRSLPIQTEWRVMRGEGEPIKIQGHAAVFDKLSDPIMGFREKVAPGAFRKSIRRKDDVRALWNHDPNYVLGRTKSGTLKLKEDDIGLAIEIQPPDTQWANDLVTTIERGDVDQMSFGFVVVKEEWTEDHKKGETVRTLEEVDLFDVSPVTFPAYPQTDVAVRTKEILEARAKELLARFEASEDDSGELDDDEVDVLVQLNAIRRKLQIIEAEYL